MKKLLLSFFIFISVSAAAQTFWTEDFGTGCNNGTAAIGFSSINGAWSVTSTGTNDNYADIWYVSARANNTGVGMCATTCTNNNNPSLHVGNADLSTLGIGPDSSCTYLTGVFCPAVLICSTTHKRVESPIINCTGRIINSVSFLYLENGEGSDDDATLWYYDGITWTLIDSLAKTTVCGSYGIWTLFTLPLPSSSNNNPNVKIGFRWTNDNDAMGSDPSFAVDNIRLQGSPTAVTDVSAQGETTIFSSGTIIRIDSKEKIKNISVTDLTGRKISFRQTENTVDMTGNTKGIYFLRAEVDGNLVTRKIFIE